MIDQTISHYRITAKLGEGGMGEVYLATDTSLDRKVALKFLPESLQKDPEARERLIREAKAASRLRHNNILTIHAVEQADGRDFIVMEYVEGKPLTESSRDMHRSIPQVLDLAIAIADGLQSAHESGVIHRDLKPANILIDRHGIPRLVDFGLAKVRGSDKLTKTGSTLGTVAYMSPEQAKGEDVDARSDIFSFGVLLYELITGRTPFQGAHEAAITYAIINEPFEPMSRYKSGVPAELERIVAKALAKSPGERYQSAADLVADLAVLRRTSTGADSMTTSLSGTARRSRRTALAIVAGIVVVAVAAAVTTRYVLHSESTRLPERKTLAVLPFQNLGAAEDEYFADGISEEITSRLAKINGLRVISRTSTQQYKNTNKSIRQIGSELGANYILEGSIRWEKASGTNVVRITPQLIQVSDDSHLWAENYERTLTQIFAVQANIAEQIARAMDLTLIEGQKSSLATVPTNNLEAYDAYLRGLDYANRGNYSGLATSELRSAAREFNNAVSLDSMFALAFARLAQTECWIFFNSWENQEASLDAAENALNHALKLAPDLPEAWLAKGTYENLVMRDYEGALESLEHARAGLGNLSDLYAEIALVKKRQGEWLEAESNHVAALDLDPRSLRKLFDLADTYVRVRRYRDAARAYERAASFAPDNADVFAGKLALYLIEGDTARARAILEEGQVYADPLRILYRSYTGPLGPWRFDLYPDIMRDPQSDMTRAAFPDSRGFTFFPLAEIYTSAGEHDRARAYYDSAMITLQTALTDCHSLMSRKGLKHEEDFLWHSMMGFVAARLGRKDLAIEQGKLATELMPVQSCFW